MTHSGLHHTAPFFFVDLTIRPQFIFSDHSLSFRCGAGFFSLFSGVAAFFFAPTLSRRSDPFFAFALAPPPGVGL
jgi:hypothetical protein